MTIVLNSVLIYLVEITDKSLMIISFNQYLKTPSSKSWNIFHLIIQVADYYIKTESENPLQTRSFIFLDFINSSTPAPVIL